MYLFASRYSILLILQVTSCISQSHFLPCAVELFIVLIYFVPAKCALRVLGFVFFRTTVHHSIVVRSSQFKETILLGDSISCRLLAVSDASPGKCFHETFLWIRCYPWTYLFARNWLFLRLTSSSIHCHSVTSVLQGVLVDELFSLSNRKIKLAVPSCFSFNSRNK